MCYLIKPLFPVKYVHQCRLLVEWFKALKMGLNRRTADRSVVGVRARLSPPQFSWHDLFPWQPLPPPSIHGHLCYLSFMKSLFLYNPTIAVEVYGCTGGSFWGTIITLALQQVTQLLARTIHHRKCT